MSKIIYTNEDGIVAVINPILTETNEATGKNWTLEEIAKKDVPTGKKYKIVNSSEVSTDRTFRNAWEINESELTDGVGD